MFIRMILAGLERDVPIGKVEHYKVYGWKEITGADPTVKVEELTSQPSTVKDSGAVKMKAPKKKADKPAEQVPEAATEDLDNDITQGE